MPAKGYLKPIVMQETAAGCHECISGSADRKGYRLIHRNGKTMGVHRFIFQETYGPIPTGMQVMHICDNPPCINPEHLAIGTDADNMADMVNKGRHVPRRCEGSVDSKLKWSDVDEILSMSVWESHRRIAKLFGVSHKTVDDIVRRVSWTDKQRKREEELSKV